MSQPVQVSRTTILELALKASVSEKTIKHRLAGIAVRGIAQDRADKALRARGIEPGALAVVEAPEK